MPLLFLGVVLINGFLNKKGIFFFIFLLQLGSVHFSVPLRIGDVYHAMSIYSFFHYCRASNLKFSGHLFSILLVFPSKQY